MEAGINAVTKSIKDIQKDLYALEDDNQYNEILRMLILKFKKNMINMLNSTDVEAPFKFDKDL